MPVYRTLPISVSGTTLTISSSQVLFADGTAAAPSMSFSADPDTGIYRAGGNRLAFSTGGSGRVFIDEIGWLFVGNAVSSSSPTTGNISGTLGSGTNIAGGDLRINGGQSTGSGAGGSIIFRTTAAGASGSSSNGATERMRITSAGDVGIGTNAPTAQSGGRVTHVYTNSNTTTATDNIDFIVESVNRNSSVIIRAANSYTSDVTFADQANATVGRIRYDHSLDSMAFRTNAGDRMQITSTGQIQVGDGTAAAPVLSFSADPDNGMYRTTTNVLSFAAGGVGQFHLQSNTAWFGRATATSGANPANFDVLPGYSTSTDTAGTNLRISGGPGTGTAAGGALIFQTSAAGGVSGTSVNSGTDRMRVKTNGQVRFVPLAADPAGAEAGDVYYNSSDNKLKVYNGTAWVDLH